MGKGLTIAALIVVLIVAAVAAYMFLGPTTPSYTPPAATTTTVTGGAGITIDDTGATSAATQAESVASQTAGEIGAVDNMEVPNVQ